MSLPRTQLESKAQFLMEQAQKNLLNDGYLAFAVLVQKGGSLVPIQVVSLETEAHKEHLGQLLRRIARDCDAIFMICESWALLNPTGANVRPSEHPDRVEVITVTGQSSEGELILTSTLHRNASGRPVTCDAATLTWCDGDEVASKFGRLFPQRDSDTAVRDAAATALAAEGFVVVLDYSSEPEKRAMAETVQSQSKTTLRAATFVATEHDGSFIMKEKWNPEYVGHFWILYANGPIYVGAAVHPTSINTRAKVRTMVNKMFVPQFGEHTPCSMIAALRTNTALRRAVDECLSHDGHSSTNPELQSDATELLNAITSHQMDLLVQQGRT